MKQPYTYSMPESFLKDKSVPARWRVLGVINGFILNGGCFYGSNEWLMEQLGCTEPTISAAFAELEKLNLVEIRRTARSRKVYRKAHDPNQLGSETQTEPVHDPSQLVPNSVSNSEKNISASEDGQRGRYLSREKPDFGGEGYEEDARPKGAPKNTKEMLRGYEIFTDQPARKTWKLREIERESMKILLEEYGHEKLVKRYAAVKAHRHDQFCPLIKSPSTFLQLMPNLERFIKNLEQ